MNRHILPILSYILCLIYACLVPTLVFGADYYRRINLTDNLVSVETIKIARLPEDLRLRRENFAHQNLSDQDLSHMLFLEANLEYTMMLNSNLTGARLIGANLRGAFLENANLTDADLTNADLMGADLRGANLTRAKLSGANLSNARLNDQTVYSQTEFDKCDTTNMTLEILLYPAPVKNKANLSDIPSEIPKEGKCSFSRAAGEAYKKILRSASSEVKLRNSSESPSPTDSPMGKRLSQGTPQKGSSLMITTKMEPK